MEADYNDPRFIPSWENAVGLTVSRDGKRLYLSADAFREAPSETTFSEIRTVAYNAANGSQVWVGRYSVSALDNHVATKIAVTPDPSKVIVAGEFNHHPFGQPNDLFPKNRIDYGLPAYDTDVEPAVRARNAVSRKVRGAAGALDIAGIECRSGGPNHDYQMVITFPTAVTFGRAAVTSGAGRVTSTSSGGAEVTVNLTGVQNAQTITLTLFRVSDGVNTNDVAVQLSVLVGDVTASSSVITGQGFDTSGWCKARSVKRSQVRISARM